MCKSFKLKLIAHVSFKLCSAFKISHIMLVDYLSITYIHTYIHICSQLKICYFLIYYTLFLVFKKN